MDHNSGEEVEGPASTAVEPEATDFADDLDRLAVVEAELAAAEAELEELDSSAGPSVSE